jgi:hypothetical protein
VDIIEKIKTEQYGFIQGIKQLAEVIAFDPYINVLIRANLNRVVVPAHLVISKCDEINHAEENNWVRDISFPVER